MRAFATGSLTSRLVLLINGVDSPSQQMNRDREIVEKVRPSFPVLLRIYRISKGVTIGRTWNGEVPKAWSVPPSKVAVRPTGGGAVLHGEDLCLSMFIPRHFLPPGPRDWPAFYESFHSAIGKFLLRIGRSPVMQSFCGVTGSPEGLRGQNDSLCFRDSVRGDLMLGEAKALGGALSVGRAVILYQGSLKVPNLEPDLLSALFEEWYCSNGKALIGGTLLMKGWKIESSDPLCPDRAYGESIPTLGTIGHRCH